MGFTIKDIANSKVAHLNGHLFQEQAKPAKRLKYGNRKTEFDGIIFDSQKEAKRYKELKLLQKAGEIGFLELQVVFELKVREGKICNYLADFVYLDQRTGQRIVEDVKSPITRRHPVYRLKKKLMKQLLNIEITEV